MKYMHIQASRFMQFCKRLFPDSFQGKCVLDVGSGDINGNNRYLFENCKYIGNDVSAGDNVTIVSKTSALPFGPNTFDTIVSTECFEHDPEWKESIQKIVSMLKPGGVFCFTCASNGRNEHGTRRLNPDDSFGVIGKVEGWMDHYKNLTTADIREAIDLDSVFVSWDAYYSPENMDLYFYGLKRGEGVAPIETPLYTESHSWRMR